ncbi:MAG: hypothetical protein OSA99_10935 [Acidimicrobiales bacterium]|nr:hypothetical protein [Acidimicrobiales bacterium]
MTGLVASAGTAGASQVSDDCAYPDGCTTSSTTPDGSDDPTCGISAESAQAGTTVTVTVQNVPAGGTVRVLFDGDVVASGSNGTQGFRGDVSGTVELDFAVPAVAPGSYSLVAVGDSFTITCGSGDFAVLASGQTTGDDGDDGALAFTGSEILLMVLLALALLAVGAALVRRSRRSAYATS